MRPRKLKCPDFFNCSLPKSEQVPAHMSRYHDPRPTFITNPIAGRPPLKIQRDPARAMHYPCPHPKCDHTSILRTDPRQHQLVCEYRDRTRFNRPTEDEILARRKRKMQPLGRRQQLQQKQPQRRRAVPRLPILVTMHQLTRTVSGFSKELDQQTESIDAIGERMDWLTDQIDQIRRRNASLEVHTESLRIDAGLVEDHLGDLVQDNRRVNEQFRDVLEDVGKMQAMAMGLGQQDIIHLD
ncbi:hypothetical protein BGZ90_001862 [Linnemannia elongata]|nr:hypothetical protein BGZ90_001862 [Linnemannia elongata]